MDIDRVLDAIRAEARRRASGSAVVPPSGTSGIVVASAVHGLPLPEPRHVADFLALPLDQFMAEAYRRILGREADAAGVDNFQRAMLRGRLTRIEVLGRLRLSPEGRHRAAPIPGLGAAFVLATFYRIPIAGPVAAWLAGLLALPAHWQDRKRIEAAALASGSWMKR